MASIRKRTWTTRKGETKTAYVADYFDQHRKRHIKTFGKKKEAEAWLTDVKGEVKRGIHTPASTSITVAEAGDTWFEEAEADGLERGSLRLYHQHLKLHIEPFLGTTKLCDLTPAVIKDFRLQLAQQGRSPVMTKKVVACLGAILASAMEGGQVAQNVARAPNPRRRREHGLEKRHKRQLEVGIDIPTKDELRAMLRHSAGWMRPLIVMAVFTGLRVSELRGLRWSDVNLDEEQVLTVRQRADHWGTIGSPKSHAGRRSVPLVPMVVNTLTEWRVVCPLSPQHLVLPTSRGRPRALSTIHRALGSLQKAAGISADCRPKYGMHSLRHAAASLFIEQGLSPKRVQALLGHSTITMTFDTYGHLFPAPEDDRTAMRQLQARLVG